MKLSRAKKREIELKVIGLIIEKALMDKQYIDIIECVQRDNFLVQSANLGSELTGYLAVNDNEPVEKGYNRLIVVNEKFENPDAEEEVVLKKSRFIIAHEYGHFILHKPDNQPIYAMRDTIHRKELDEQEADYFARSILMPARVFLKLNEGIENLRGEIDMNQKIFDMIKLHLLSSHFNVTRNKVKLRLEDIELLESIVNSI